MAELVDALVSNTNAARRAGSIPALGTRLKAKCVDYQLVTTHFTYFGATLVQQLRFFN